MKIVQLVRSAQRGDSDVTQNIHKRIDARHRILHDNGSRFRPRCNCRHTKSECDSRNSLSLRIVRNGKLIRNCCFSFRGLHILRTGELDFDRFLRSHIKRKLRILISALLLLPCLGSCDGSWSSYATYDEIRGKVVRVADGDTITIREPDSEQIKIRLFGIDAPERGQAFGKKSRRTLAGLVANQTVDILIEDEDQYGRTVGIVLLNEENINLSMVRAGMAWVYRRYQENPQWLEAEADARNARRGLWSDPDPEPPADWRYRNRN